MGCNQSSPPASKAQDKAPLPANYAFGRDESLNKADYMLTGRSGETVVKRPGEIGGQQFLIDECTDCDIFLLDHISTITIDRCRGCRIFVGPTSESLFVRDCHRCSFAVAVRQFRTRDCSKCVTLLYSATQPVIEASSGMRFGCFEYGYFSLASQFEAAALPPWNNLWCAIHDFTPEGGNWEPLPLDVGAGDVLPPLPADVAAEVGFALSSDRPVVPRTLGAARRPAGAEQAFACLLPDHADRAGDLVRAVAQHASGVAAGAAELSTVLLVQTKELPLDAGMAGVLFEGDKALAKAAARGGRSLGLEWCGAGAVSAVRTAAAVLQLPPGSVFVARDAPSAGTHVRSFFDNWREEV